MNPGHGNHWEAVDKDCEKTVREILPRACEEGEALGGALFSHELTDVPWKKGRVIGLKYLDSPLSFIALVAMDLWDKNTTLWSGYPFCSEGIDNGLVVDSIDRWDNGAEGLVTAHAPDGGILSFFDPLFFLDESQLKVGEERLFTLAALAYTLRKSEQTSIVIDEGPLLEIEREQQLRDNPGSEPPSSVTVSLSGMAALMPHSEYPDDADARFTIEEVSEFRVAERPFIRLTGIVMRLDGRDVRLTVYVSKETLEGYTPQVGDDVEAILWVQGFLKR